MKVLIVLFFGLSSLSAYAAKTDVPKTEQPATTPQQEVYQGYHSPTVLPQEADGKDPICTDPFGRCSPHIRKGTIGDNRPRDIQEAALRANPTGSTVPTQGPDDTDK